MTYLSIYANIILPPRPVFYLYTWSTLAKLTKRRARTVPIPYLLTEIIDPMTLSYTPRLTPFRHGSPTESVTARALESALAPASIGVGLPDLGCSHLESPAKPVITSFIETEPV